MLGKLTVARERLAPGRTGAEAQNDNVAANRDRRSRVRLVTPPVREPATETESWLTALLAKENELSYEALVARLAESLYRKELGAGAWAIDIGLFGSKLFIQEAIRELEAGKGQLWNID